MDKDNMELMVNTAVPKASASLTEEKYKQIYDEYEEYLEMQDRNRKRAKRKMVLCNKSNYLIY